MSPWKVLLQRLGIHRVRHEYRRGVSEREPAQPAPLLHLMAMVVEDGDLLVVRPVRDHERGPVRQMRHQTGQRSEQARGAQDLAAPEGARLEERADEGGRPVRQPPHGPTHLDPGPRRIILDA